MAEKKRVDWIDIAKGLGILLMIVGHTFLNESFVRKLVFSFHMPLFFILAGYTFRVKPIREVVVSSAKRLLVPYALVYWSLQLAWYVQQPAVGLHDIQMSLLGFVFASGTELYSVGIPAAGVIWFLVALFCARVTLNAVTAFFENRNVPEWGQLLFWVAFALVGMFINRKLPLSYDVAMVACLFMYGGYLAKKHDLPRLMRRVWTLPIAIAVWALCVHFSYLELAARMYDLVPFSIIGAFAGSYVVYQLSYAVEHHVAVLKRPLVWLGQASLLLLCIHAFDYWLVPWQTLPMMASVPLPYFVAGCLRAVFDVLLAVAFKKV